MSNETSHSPRRGSLSLHLCCGAWILLVALLSLARHRDLQELRAAAEDGPVEARPEAYAALRQCEEPRRFETTDPRLLLASREPLLREFAFTNTFTRSPLQRLTVADLDRIEDLRERFRASVWLHCRTTTPRRITLADLDRWFSEAER